MSSLPPSRLLHKSDWLTYPERLRACVGQHFVSARPQHDARMIEYACALAAVDDVWAIPKFPLTAVDVGGDGSPFGLMLQDRVGVKPIIVDPASGGADLHNYLGQAPRLAHVLTCLSVLEHVPRAELPQMIDDLATLLAPGGVLVITADVALNVTGDVSDTFHFHWMRERIFTADTFYQEVVAPLLAKGLQPLGTMDYATAVEPWCYNYGFISGVFVKPVNRRR